MGFLTQQQVDALKAKGLSEQRIAELAESRGDKLPTGNTGLAGVATGVAKGVGGLLNSLAPIGRPIQAALDPTKTLEQYKAQAVPDEAFDAKSPSEQVGKTAFDVATFFVPTAKGTQLAGRVLKGGGEAVSKIGIGLSSKEAPLVQMYRAKTPLYERMGNLLKGVRSDLKPVTNRETAIKKNIFGTEGMIGVQATRAAYELWKGLIAPALKKTETRVDMKSFLDDVQAQVDEIVDPARKEELQSALNAFSDGYKSVYNISFEQLQKYKEGWAKFIPEKAYKGKPIASSFREIQNIAAQIARNKIYKELGDEAKVAYLDYGNLKNLQELGVKALTGSKLKGGAGGFINGIKDATLTPIATTSGLTLYRIGNGLEFVGTQGLKKVADLFGL